VAYGFVYLLGNPAMPCYYKIGCTERAPHERARQLSAASGVPHPFHVLLYIEVDQHQKVEQRFHREISDFRARGDREFFCFGPAHMNWVWHAFADYPERLSFAAPHWHKYSFKPQFPDDHVETWSSDLAYLHLPNVGPIEDGELKVSL
jgi:hypothetical protein